MLQQGDILERIGAPGECGSNYIMRAGGDIVRLKGNDEIEMDRGDLLVMETPGGGGFGKS